ncbi:MAG: AraC family transcriptional regulator [Actinobacteria bacterium]|nr:AraC family transcriptional regulator [Actinomycetota bacterium]
MESPVRFEHDLLPGAEASHHATVERVVAEMRERVDETLSLRAMAEIAHLSPYHFARTFRRITGIPPGEFLSALLLQRAKELLLTTDLSASEVCYEVGYKSLGTFTSRFTQLVGVSPGRMRRLTEELSAALEGVAGAERPPIPPEPENAGVTFRLHGDGLSGSWIFAGLFPGAACPNGGPWPACSSTRRTSIVSVRSLTAPTTSWPPPCPTRKIPWTPCYPAQPYGSAAATGHHCWREEGAQPGWRKWRCARRGPPTLRSCSPFPRSYPNCSPLPAAHKPPGQRAR